MKGLAGTKPAKSVHDAGWTQFVNMLGYKAKRYGRSFAEIDRVFPSSKLCSTCGTRAESMPLNVLHAGEDVNAGASRTSVVATRPAASPSGR
ncbi:transposase [Nonomuraea fuscirosea]|uniref:transposase n=1 Tax=Nonomuraea fuscirosea TaxID=1291556 RepID=UPI002DDC59B0|nr:transposase [Nonomuraea fuscirosea]